MVARDAGQQHWTHRLFVERPELYLPFLEQAEERSTVETGALTDMFRRYGVPAGGRVLDLACGTGRHAVPIARRGYHVTGIDLSSLYIEKARARAGGLGARAEFLVGDMREVESLARDRGPYDAIINMFTSSGYYGREADVELFARLRTLCSPGAIMVILTVNREWLVRHFEPEGLDRAGHIRILQRRRLDLETSTIYSDWEFFEGEGDRLRLELKLRLDHRVYDLRELKATLLKAGWSFVQGLGSDRGAGTGLVELTPDLMDMWVVAKADGPHSAVNPARRPTSDTT